MAAARAQFTTLYEEHYDAVYAFCARRVGYGDAGDATADVFTVVWRRIDEMSDQAAVGWLFGIARGVVLNRWRAQKRRHRLVERVGSLGRPAAEGPDVVIVQNEETETVLRALQRLRPTDQDILVMSAWDELTGPQIAQALGISVAAAEQRIHRAKKRLARALRSSPVAVHPRAGGVEPEGGEA